MFFMHKLQVDLKKIIIEDTWTFFYFFVYHQQELITLLLLPKEQVICGSPSIPLKLYNRQFLRDDPCYLQLLSKQVPEITWNFSKSRTIVS